MKDFDAYTNPSTTEELLPLHAAAARNAYQEVTLPALSRRIPKP